MSFIGQRNIKGIVFDPDRSCFRHRCEVIRRPGPCVFRPVFQQREKKLTVTCAIGVGNAIQLFYFNETARQTVSIFLLPQRKINPEIHGIARALEAPAVTTWDGVMKKLLLTDVALTRWTLVVLVATIQTAGIRGDAIAETGKGHLHARHLASEGYRVEAVNSAQARLGSMRYYGGPKSPMWRGPVEN